MKLTELAGKPSTKLTVAEVQSVRMQGRVVTAYYGDDGEEYECVSQRGQANKWFRLDFDDIDLAV